MDDLDTTIISPYRDELSAKHARRRAEKKRAAEQRAWQGEHDDDLPHGSLAHRATPRHMTLTQ